jgi:hypothetical protein
MESNPAHLLRLRQTSAIILIISLVIASILYWRILRKMRIKTPFSTISDFLNMLRFTEFYLIFVIVAFDLLFIMILRILIDY